MLNLREVGSGDGGSLIETTIKPIEFLRGSSDPESDAGSSASSHWRLEHSKSDTREHAEDADNVTCDVTDVGMPTDSPC